VVDVLVVLHYSPIFIGEVVALSGILMDMVVLFT
jgi:hypothetical protein